MLDQHHLEQHHRIDAGASIILAIERLHHFIQLCEVHRCIYLSQQMLLRHQLVYDYELYQISIHFPAFQHLASPLPILPYLSEKAQLQPDFFDRLEIFGLQTGKTLSALYYYAAHKVVPMRLDAVWNTWKTDEIVDLEQLHRAWEEGIYDAERAVGSR